MKRAIVSILIGAIIGTLAGGCHWYKNSREVEVIEKPVIIMVEKEKHEEYTPHTMTEEDLALESYYDSLEYLACLVEAEAGNQDEYGKRLVCDVVLNRVDSDEFPNDIWQVIDEPGQFTTANDNGLDFVIPSEETYRIVREEIENRTNCFVLYFRTGKYHSFAEDLFKHDAHFFSK